MYGVRSSAALEACAAMTFDEYLALQREEILRHKWIESEKAGRDLGQDAVLDWIVNHARAFRRYLTEVGGECIDWHTVARRR